MNRFSGYLYGTTSPALGSYVVTPDDNQNLPEAIRAVTLGSGGALAWRSAADDQIYQTANLPAGTYALNAVAILATGTTATDITGWV